MHKRKLCEECSETDSEGIDANGNSNITVEIQPFKSPKRSRSKMMPPDKQLMTSRN